MMAKLRTRVENGIIEERCTKCCGLGWVEHHCGGLRIEHPLNDQGRPKSFLFRCACGRYWREFYQKCHESESRSGVWLPDEYLGMECPPDDWEPEGGWKE